MSTFWLHCNNFFHNPFFLTSYRTDVTYCLSQVKSGDDFPPPLVDHSLYFELLPCQYLLYVHISYFTLWLSVSMGDGNFFTQMCFSFNIEK